MLAKGGWLGVGVGVGVVGVGVGVGGSWCRCGSVGADSQRQRDWWQHSLVVCGAVGEIGSCKVACRVEK